MNVGHGDSNSRNIPTLVKDISNVGEVSCGSSHTIALSKDGRTVWSFGGGDNGVYPFTCQIDFRTKGINVDICIGTSVGQIMPKVREWPVEWML